MNINDYRLFLEFVSNKQQIGRTFTTSQFNLLADRAQKQKFEQDYSVFIATSSITEYLSTFLKTTTLPVNGQGKSSYPSDYAHLSSLNFYYVKESGQGKMVPIKEVKNADWSEIGASTLLKPTKRYPKFSFYANEISFLPRDIGLVSMDYFKEPSSPVWGFTIVNSREVYDPTTSVQFESPDFSMNDIMALMLSFVGINIQVPMLVQYAEQFKANNK